MMMTQDEEDLEEELRCLDIREDHGAEDSDVTPINTPPCTPPILYIKKYPPFKPFEERHKETERHSRLDDFDSRSESSLSWGDDEFEGEATRQVGALFDQLDSLLYKEETPLSPIPYSLETSSSSNSPIFIKNMDHPLGDFQEVISKNAFHNLSRLTSTSESESSFTTDQVIDVEDVTSEIFYDSGRLITHSGPAPHQPSPELQEECLDWVDQFPHFRIRGYQLSSGMLNILDHCLDTEALSQESDYEGEEETIAQDGDFYHLLPLVTCNSANQTKERANPKREAPSSRVCSGSNDPDVLKEQVLIMLFDKLWSSMTGIIEPLLHRYAKYVIEQSVQYSSLSRESSTKGSRVGNQMFNRKVSEELVRTKPKFPVPSDALHRPNSGAYGRNHSANRPLSTMRRPLSAANRLQSAASVPDVLQEELEDLLQVSPKVLQSHEDRGRSRTSSASTTRGSSAQSFKSQISLPSLTTPRTPVHRPVSSKTANHLLTPMKVEVLSSGVEQQPASTSSYHSRARFQEKLQHLSRQGTIQETRGDDQELEGEEEASSVWSRHISFLPPISDNSEVASCKPQSPVMTGESPLLATLSVRGKPLLAAHRPQTHSRRRKHVLASGMQPVVPFLSWVMEHVDSGAKLVMKKRNLVAKNAFVNGEIKNNCWMRSKQFKRSEDSASIVHFIIHIMEALLAWCLVLGPFVCAAWSELSWMHFANQRPSMK
ncbi:uncharacterized protein LOC135106913 isoform X4 [Scylla paramamosain]|uniref:uncharacterized protein LOC135106913 isoform X4 n=1 Tax=Scylla paramamosain TaxID=85552 RepID=UPI003082E631